MLLSTFSVLCLAALEIKLPDDPKAWEVTAKSELTEFFSRAVKQGVTIDGKELKKVEIRRADQLPEESWFYRSEGDTLIIGGSGRGVLYGVYQFLERELDIRFLTDDAESVPVYEKTLKLGKLDRSGKPVLIYRDIFRSNMKNDQGKFAARMRLNRRGDEAIAARFGGTFHYGKPYHCHTFCFYIPEKKYLKSNPDYFALINGKRRGGFATGQLCLSNPEIVKIILPQLRQNIINDRAAAARNGRAPYVLFDLSINDNAFSCSCEKCKKEVAEYGHSGQLLRFLNPIAEAIGKEFPGVYITTLAYFHCEALPKKDVRPAKNLIIKFCDTITNQAAPITAKENQLYLERLQKWGKISDNLFIWDYSIAYHSHIYPYPSEFDIASTTREYLKNKVSGIFWEHEHPCCGDMHELKVYVEARTMEDPSLDGEKVIREFCERFYGDAGKYVFAARKKLCEVRKKNNGFVPWMAYIRDFSFIDPAAVKEINGCFDKAAQAVKDDKILSARVRKARLGLDLLVACRLVELQQSITVDTKALAARLTIAVSGSDHPAYCQKKCQTVIRTAKNMLAFIEKVKPLAKDAEFIGNGAFDLALPAMFNHDPNLIRIVGDPDASAGVAVIIEAAKNAKGYKAPFDMGIHDQEKGKTLFTRRFKDIPTDGKYHWLSLKPVNVTSGCYLYLSRTWKIQHRIIAGGSPDQKLEVKVRIRFTGELFNNDRPGDPGTIWIDRIVCVPVK